MSDEKKKSEWIANPPELDGVPDLSQLIYLDMKNVLNNLEFRYSKMSSKFCYTSISSILLAINPYESLPIYGRDVITQFHESSKKGKLLNRPHPYAVSARSYMRMVQRKCNQSVVVCGESGAGKTETTKLLMRYLAMTAPSTSIDSSTIETQIVAASPILEAYGNAKTVLNNNSSRFGKFTKLLYNVPTNQSKHGMILGSSLNTYLLEKSRVVFQSKNERNYHIFYFLHESDQHRTNKSEFGLGNSIAEFNYTNQGQCFDSFKDGERFQELCESLDLFRIEKREQDILWKITSGILNLGNINFFRKGDGFASVDSKSMKYVEIVSKLWGISAESLEKRLTTASLTIRKQTVVKGINFNDAEMNRDSIAKGVYENIFLWLCKRINAELLVDTDDDDDESKSDDGSKSDESKFFIGILDVFGFENFYINSLEQFCINFTNEKLQQYFNAHIIRSEQEEYLRESVFWKPLTIPDNMEYINMVENKKIGFFKLLDSACNGVSKDPEAFMQHLMKTHSKNEKLTLKTKPGSGSCRGKPATRNNRNKRKKFNGFMIEHFADDVTYDISEFLIKNSESVHMDTAKMINKSDNVIFKQINTTNTKNGKKSRKKKKSSVTSVFNNGIKKLMKNLRQTEPFFVRCINPNKQRSCKIWNKKIVEHQLRCGGLIEALRVLKLGYPTRVPYQLLYDKYHSNVTNPLISNMKPAAFSTALLIAFDVNTDDFELGLTKIFFKPSKAAVLDTIMSKAGEPLSVEQNEKITKYIVGKRITQMIGTVKAYSTLHKLVRMRRAQKIWENAGRVASILGGSVLKNLEIARRNVRERKEKKAALMMQSFFRGKYERCAYVKKIDKCKKATKQVWIAYQCMNARNGLRDWVDAKVEEKRILIENQEKKEQEIAVVPVVEAAVIPKPVPVVVVEPVLTKEEKLVISRKEKQVLMEQKQQELEQEIAEKREKQEQKSLELKLKKKEIEREALLEMEKEKQISIKMAVKLKEKQAREIAKKNRKRRQRKKNYRKYGHNVTDDSDSDDSSSDGGDDNDDSEEFYDDLKEEEMDLKSLLKRFAKDAMMGQLFLRHTGTSRSRKAQERVVKISFKFDGKPNRISWGGNSRFISFKDILYISHGHYTVCFNAKKDVLEEKRCFSIVSRNEKNGYKILDLEAKTDMIALVWVKGLRKLIGANDNKSDEMAQKNLKNLLNAQKQQQRLGHKHRKKEEKFQEIMDLQRDLFLMSYHTVFRILVEERIWQIDANVQEKFDPLVMYKAALEQDISWRSWQPWINKQITDYLRNNNLVHYSAHHHSQHSHSSLVVNNPYETVRKEQLKKAKVNVNNNVNIKANINNKNNGDVRGGATSDDPCSVM